MIRGGVRNETENLESTSALPPAQQLTNYQAMKEYSRNKEQSNTVPAKTLRALAEFIRTNRHAFTSDSIEGIMRFCEMQNPSFKRDLFIKAIGGLNNEQ